MAKATVELDFFGMEKESSSSSSSSSKSQFQKFLDRQRSIRGLFRSSLFLCSLFWLCHRRWIEGFFFSFLGFGFWQECRVLFRRLTLRFWNLWLGLVRWTMAQVQCPRVQTESKFSSLFCLSVLLLHSGTKLTIFILWNYQKKKKNFEKIVNICAENNLLCWNSGLVRRTFQIQLLWLYFTMVLSPSSMCLETRFVLFN